MKATYLKLKNNVHHRISKIPQKIIFDFGNPQNTIFISGSARSGTTWIEEIINYNNQYRVMFEPFHPNKVKLISDWKYFQYLSDDEISEKYMGPMKKILSGKVRNNWIDKHNRRIVSNKRIIKAIHANLFLHWMKHNFPEVPIVFVLRHPCAVANSKMNISSDWYKEPNLKSFLSQKELMDDFLHPFTKNILEVNNPYEKFIYLWCIENFIPLKQFANGEIFVTFYEHMCLHPEQETKRLFDFLKISNYLDAQKMIDKPSIMSRVGSAIKSGNDLLTSWRTNISDDQIRKAMEILNLFGLDQIYRSDSLPLVSGEKALDLF